MDLIGGPFSVIESDPGVFTSLTRKLGVKNLSVVEVFDIEPWATDHLQPHGLVFCFHWRKDVHRPAEFENPEQVWFANQLSDDACASHAILNVLLNCPTVDLGLTLQQFRDETKEMSPVMKGLAVTNSTHIRNAHNSLARQADLRGSLNAIATTTLDIQKAKAKELQSKKKQTATPSKSKPSKSKSKTVDSSETTEEEVYHFIGYVPAFGKVWELDGLKPGPLEVGELASEGNTTDWMDVARPAIRMKMAKYGGSADAGNIRFSLLAFVDGSYEKANDEWEYWRRERRSIERRLDETDSGWKSKASSTTVDQELLKVSEHAFTLPDAPGRMFLQAGSRRLLRDADILSSPPDMLLEQWENAVQQAARLKTNVEDEAQKAATDWSDFIKRTHDYEPFCVEYIRCLHRDGFLEALLDIAKNITPPQTVVKAKKPKMSLADENFDQEGLGVRDIVENNNNNDDDDAWKPTPSRQQI
ncbi:cysteine proteinase [Lentinula edodes]|nr:cysteine proteinase [Lentinula edodes]